MATTLLGELAYTIGIRGMDTFESEINSASDTAGTSSNKMVDAFKKVGAAVAAYFTVQAITDFAKATVQAAADVAAETSAYNQIMGDYADEANAKIQSVAEQTGIVDTLLQPTMTSMTAKFQGLGFGIEEATDLAQSGLLMAADASAFWNVSLDDAKSHLNSFINGSYEGGEAIGLFANDTQLAQYAVKQGLVESTAAWASLDEATKQATRMEYAQAMLDSAGITGQAARESEEYAVQQANLTEKWRQFKAQIGEPILQNIVIPAIGLLSSMLDGLSGIIENVTNWINENQTAWTVLTTVVTGVTVAVGAFLLIMNFGLLMSIAATAIGAVQKAFLALNATMLANPIVLIVALIAGLIAAFVMLWDNCEDFRNFWIDLWDSIKEVFSAVVEWIKEALSKIGKFFSDTWNAISTTTSNIWNGIKNTISNVINGIKNTVSNVFNTVKNTISDVFNGIKTTVTNIWNSIKNAITSPIEKARDTVKKVIDKIKSFFNFEWSLPKLKMPHISINGEFSLLPPKAPKFSIDWYAKGGILNDPTIFGMGNSGTFLGGGEAGAEAVAPIDVLQDYVRTAVSEQNNGILESFNRLTGMLAEYLPQLVNKDNQIVLDSGALVGAIAPQMDSKLGDIYSVKGRGQ